MKFKEVYVNKLNILYTIYEIIDLLTLDYLHKKYRLT